MTYKTEPIENANEYKFNSIDEYDKTILAGRDWKLHQVELVNESNGEVIKLARVPITVDWASCPKNHSLKYGDIVWYLRKETGNGLIEKRCQFDWHIMTRHSFEWKIREKWFKRNIRGR